MISIMTVVKITRSSRTASAAAGIAAEQLKIRVSGIVHHVQNHLAGSISPQLAKRASLLGQWSSLSLGVSIMCEKGGRERRARKDEKLTYGILSHNSGGSLVRLFLKVEL